MITIICATHRPQNQTKAVVNSYKTLLTEKHANVQILDMSELPKGFVYSGWFGEEVNGLTQILDKKIVPAEKLVVIAPEYNGSFPGIFKAFIDSVSPSLWNAKKVALVGVATGRAGNLRGMDHLTSIFHYLKAEVFSNKLPISVLDNLLDEEGTLSDKSTIELLSQQIEDFLKF